MARWCGLRTDWIVATLVLLLLCSIGWESARADGPIRRLIRGTRTPTAIAPVCESGVCYPTVTYVSDTTTVAVSPAKSAPVAVSFDLGESPIVETSAGTFHGAVIQAAVQAQKAGKINRRDLITLRVAMLSPAFRSHVEDLALVQVAASGEDAPFKVNADGSIDRTSIDWQGLASFLEKLVPLIIMLLKAFGI
jgi:hypothetical protein